MAGVPQCPICHTMGRATLLVLLLLPVLPATLLQRHLKMWQRPYARCSAWQTRWSLLWLRRVWRGVWDALG